VHDAEGRATVTGTNDIPFLLIIPAGADVTSLPVAILGHGSPRTMEDGFVLADTLGAAGIAVLAFDQYQHGGRAGSAVDEHTVRGVAGSDGIFEHDRTAVQAALAALSGVPVGVEASVAYLEGDYTQVLADAFAVMRLRSRASRSTATRSTTSGTRSARSKAACSSPPSPSSTPRS
jgi:hypothetical protein